MTTKIFSLVLLLMLETVCGCASQGRPITNDLPVLMDERRPDLAERLGVGQEIELTRRVQLVKSNGYTFGMRAAYPRSERNGTFLGYLPAGTRLRVEHAWSSPPEEATPRIGSLSATFRILPDHDPLPLPLASFDVTGGWEPLPGLGAGYGNVYTLPGSHTRLVPPEERTPEDQIKPLTKRQEWPRGWRR